MYIQKINKNKLEVFIVEKDLEVNELTINDFMSSSAERHSFLLDVLKLANKKMGFDLKKCEIVLESFSIPNLKSFIITITRIPYRLHKGQYKKLILNTYFLAKFKRFNTVCAFCTSLNTDTVSSLYFYKDFYYLNIKIKHISEFKKILFSLKEFTKDYKFNFFMDENANLIARDNAIELCKNFFVS